MNACRASRRRSNRIRSRLVNAGPAFTAFGTALRSDLDLADYLPAASPAGSARTIDVRQAATPPLAPAFRWPFAVTHGRQLTAASDQAFRGATTGQRWWLEVEDTATFHWTVGQSTLAYAPGPEAHDAALAFWLIHSVLPSFLALEGSYHFLHAAAATLAGGAVLLVGPSGSGKSTLLSALLDRGGELVSDDKVAIREQNGRFHAVPSHPRFRPYRRHEDLGRPAPAVAGGPVPLGVLLRLQPTEPTADIRFRPIRGADKLRAISNQLLFGFSDSAPTHFAFLARLLDRAPLFELRAPRDLARLDELGDAIIHRFAPTCP